LLEEETQQLEENVTNLIKVAESNFDPSTLWALTEELPFLQNFKAIEDDFLDDADSDDEIDKNIKPMKVEIPSISKQG